MQLFRTLTHENDIIILINQSDYKLIIRYFVLGSYM